MDSKPIQYTFCVFSKRRDTGYRRAVRKMLIKSYENSEEGRERSSNWGKQQNSVRRLSSKDREDVCGDDGEEMGGECKEQGGLTDLQARLGRPFGRAEGLKGGQGMGRLGVDLR